MTRFGIIRHAPTEWNENKRIQGQQDSPLSPKGKAMAAEWGKQLRQYKWDRIFCSDLQRVQETVKLVNMTLSLPVETDAQLKEQDWGTWTGMTLGEVKAIDKDKVKEQEQKGWNFRPPGGESRNEVLQRSLRSLADAHSSWPDDNILLVTHEGVIKCLLYHLLDRKFLPEEPKVIERYNLHLLTMEKNKLSLINMNTHSLKTISARTT